MRCSKCKQKITDGYIKLRGYVIHKSCINKNITEIMDNLGKRKKKK